MTPLPHPSPRWALVALSLSMLLSSLGTSIANVALPTLVQAFGASFQQVQWVVLAYLLILTSTIVSVGRLGDLVGRKRLLLAGLGLYTLAALLCGLAPTLGLLIAARAVQGLGAAALMALTMAFVGDIFPKERTGRAMGLLGTMSAIGTALGPSLGGGLIALVGWRSIFLVSLPLGLMAVGLAWRHLPEDRARPKADQGRFDVWGMALLGGTLTAYALAMTLGRGSFGLLNIALLLVAVAGAGLFILVEAKVSSPLIRLALFRDRGLSAGVVMSGLVSTVMMSTLVVGPFYLAGGLGLDAAVVGLVLSTGPIVSALTGVPAGRLVDRFGAGRMTILGLMGIAGGAAALALIPARFGVLGYIGPLIMTTAGYGLFQAANNTGVMADVRADQRGVIAGLLNLSRNLGLITGASLMGAIFAFAAGGPDIGAARPDEIAGGMRVSFTVAAALILLALGLAVRRPAARVP